MTGGGPDRPDPREGLAHEPHLRPGGPGAGGGDRLDEEPARADRVPAEAPEHMMTRAVADEPALAWAGIDRARAPGFREILADRVARTSGSVRAAAAVAATLAAGPFAVLGALLESVAGSAGRMGYLAIVAAGPVVEEMMKIAAVLWMVERRPWLLSSPASILMIGLAGGIGFAAIENLIYLHVYFPGAGPGLARWRWSVCVAMHAVCSTIAAAGVARMWREVQRTGSPARTAHAFPYLVTAMLLHGAYNAWAVAWSMFGGAPE
jgi:hypothetical protein